MLADSRHASDAREQVTADSLEALALDVDVHPLRDRVDVDLPAEDEAPVSFVDDLLGFDIVFVANLADDFLEQIFERHQPRRPAVFVDDDGALRLVRLKLLQQLGHELRFRHDHGRANQRRDRHLVVARAEHDQILDEYESRDVVEALLEHREARVLLLAKQAPELADRRRLLNSDEVGPRRHHFANQRVAEVDDALQEAPFFGLNQPLLLRRVDVGLGRLLGFHRFFVGRRRGSAASGRRHRARASA